MKKILLFFAFVCAAVPSYGQILLKQSTATTVNGKLTKIADGTDHTGLAVTNITAKFIKQSDTLASTVTAITCAASGSSNDCVEIAAGMYNMELSASNTDTLGRLDVCMLASGDYTDCTRYEVVPSGFYDFAVTTGPATINSSGGIVEANVKKWLDTTASTPTVAGVPNVNVKTVNDIATTSVTTVSAYQGTTQPINFTGTGASALAKSDMVDVAGAAVSTSTAQIGANVVNIAGSAVTAAAGIPEVKITAGGLANAAFGANALSASKIDPDVTTEFQTGLYTFRKNVAGQNVPIWMFASSDSSPTTGLSTSAITCTISKDFAAAVTTNDTSETEVGAGEYYITLSQAESNADVLTYTCNAASQRQFQANIYPQH